MGTTILKLGWDFGPGAVCDAVGACKLVDFILLRTAVTNSIEECLSFGSHNFMIGKINW